MKALFEQLLPVLAPLLLSALTAGTGWVALHLGALLRAKAQGSRWAAVVAPLDDLVFSIVQDIEANEKPVLLKAAGAGTLTAADGAALKKIALDRLKAAMGPEGLEALKKALGALFSGTNLDALLSGKVEVAVAKAGALGASTAALQVASPS